MTAVNNIAISTKIDFSFLPDARLGELGGAASRFNYNVAAIKLLKRLEAAASANENVCDDESCTLARYSGWGDGEVLRRLFPNGAYSWAPICKELDGVLSQDERDSLAASALNAHYTPLPMIRAIYAALEHYGLGLLPQIRVLEPAAGVGHFFGAMSTALAMKAERVAVEIDTLSARIFRLLYPNVRLYAQPFEETPLPQEYFDLIISNVPFGNYPVHDPSIKTKYLKAAIHDYYFARSLQLIRPGGILAFITSRYTLDKLNDRVRRHLAEHAELLAAVRLPAGAFAKTAGTEVIADVLLVRKRTTPAPPQEATVSWLATEQVTYGNGYGAERAVSINCWFTQQPHLMLGRPGIARGMHQAFEFDLEPDGRELAEALQQALIAQLPKDGMGDVTTGSVMPLVTTNWEAEKGSAVSLDGLSGVAQQRASLLLDLYTAAKEVIQRQLLDASDEAVSEAQRELNTLYQRFTARYGFINAKQSLKDLDHRSPLVPFLRALEEPAGKGYWKKSALFTKRTIRPYHRTAHAGSAKEALLVCLNECGRVDLDRIAALTVKSPSGVTQELQGLIYELPSGAYQTAEEYLSGNVGQKQREAERAAALNSRFQVNVEALAKVQPKPLGAEDIAARLGAGWIPAAVVKSFITDLGIPFLGELKYIEGLSIWKIENITPYERASIEATQTYGTSRVNAFELLEDALNLRTPVVFDLVLENGNERRVVNDNETLAAQAKLAELKLKFTEWVWKDEKRAKELCALYNERFNCLRERRYDGSHLNLPGMNTSLELRSHQKDGIWRILQSKATLLGHCVGAGKTYLMIAAALELKRLGLCHKAMVVVPNHLPAQWEAEARRLYPNINLLAPTKEDLSAAQRGELMARIATGDYDLIIVPHSAFKLLPLAQATVARYIAHEIDTLEAYLEEIPPTEHRSQQRTVKEIQRALKRLTVKLKDCENAIQRDSQHTITWEELGVDALFVDEAHYYKNLYCPTKMNNVAGLPNSDSQRAFDAFIKVRSVLDNGGRVVFATATPVSNTLAEVYVMMKFLQLDTLEALGLAHFDAWVQTFAETSQGLEMKPDGSGFRMNTRFNKFTNLPELAALWRQVLDVKNAEQLNLPRPQLTGGAPQVVSLPASPALKKFVKSLAERVERIKSKRVAPEVDNMLKVTSEGRKAALDIRLVMPGQSKPQHSKVEALADKLVEFYHASNSQRGVQLVFCDLATPKAKAAAK